MSEPQLVSNLRIADLPNQPESVADVLLDCLISHGCQRAFGILGGAAVPLFSEMVRRGLRPIHVRHESGAVFSALEHDLAGGGPGLVFTTTGPGLINALTGVAAARHEGGRVVLLSALTGGDRRGRGAFQETNDERYAHCGLFTSGGWFDYAVALESATELAVVRARLLEGLTRPDGFVAHIGIPLALQAAAAPVDRVRGVVSIVGGTIPDAVVDLSLAELHDKRVVVWVGYGARTAVGQVRDLVDALDARVMCSPRAKGIFPETDPRFIGVTGFGGHPRVFPALAGFAPDTTLVLGSRLGEFTSFWDRRLVGASRLVHVDVDRRAFGAAYPDVDTLGIHAEIGTWLRAILARRPRVVSTSISTAPAPREVVARRTSPGVRPSQLMACLQQLVVESTDIPILSEAGNAFLWTTHALRFDEPGRYRTSMSFGSMGHFTAGVFGVALARGGPAIAVVGDGAMLMTNEVSSAVSLDVPAIWVVLNDARYGLVADGMQGLGHAPVGLDFTRVDFAAYARSLGATGIAVDCEADLDDAIERALEVGGPVIVDVRIDSAELAPFGERNRSLADQQGELSST